MPKGRANEEEEEEEEGDPAIRELKELLVPVERDEELDLGWKKAWMLIALLLALA